MAILDAQAWSNAVDADTKTEFNRQPRWSCLVADDCLFDADGSPFGAGSWSPRWGGEWIRIDGSFGETTIYCASYVLIGSTAQNDIMKFYEGSFATLHVSIEENDGWLEVMRAGAFSIARCVAPPVGVWFHLAVKLTIHDTTGVIEVRYNDREVMNETGLDTRNGGAAGVIDAVALEGRNTYITHYAEPVIWNGSGDSPTGFFGLHRVHMIKPDGETSVQFTPQGAGTNDVEVDEQACDDDTTYNSSATATNKDKLTVESLPTAVKTVHSVQAKCQARDDAGTDNIKIGLDSGTESLSAAQALTSGVYNIFEGPLETVDPNTAAAWTEANVNATDVVYEHA